MIDPFMTALTEKDFRIGFLEGVIAEFAETILRDKKAPPQYIALAQSALNQVKKKGA